MHDTDQHAAVRTEQRTAYAPTTQERTHTTQSLAELHSVKSQTIGSWVGRWLTQVAPESLLKVRKGVYSELTHTLLQEFVQVDERERPLWVADAKERYAAEWGSAGVIDCEVMPDNVGGTLALLSANNSALQESIALELMAVEGFIDSLNTADANLSEAETQNAIARGTKRAIDEFRVEESAKAQVSNQLRQRRLGGENS